MQKLVDGDLASNNSGWQLSAGIGIDAQPCFRVFNPVRQGMTFDSEGDYVRKWIPELRNVPRAEIHSPWTLTGLEKDHRVLRSKALELYRQARRESSL